MLGKPRLLSLSPNLFNKINKNMNTHVRSSICVYARIIVEDTLHAWYAFSCHQLIFFQY